MESGGASHRVLSLSRLRTGIRMFSVVMAVALTSPAAAQDDWRQLNQLQPNQSVKVYLQSGDMVKGRVQAWTADGLELLTSQAGVRRIDRVDVARVTRKSRVRGALWGGLISFGIAAPVGAFAGPYIVDWGNPQPGVRLRAAAGWGLFFGGVGAGIGALAGVETTLVKQSGAPPGQN